LSIVNILYFGSVTKKTRKLEHTDTMPLKNGCNRYGNDAYATKEASFLMGEICPKPERIYTSIVWTYSIR
jgi:hypothetical protein